MAIFNKTQFKELSEIDKGYCISIYVPTQRSGENKTSAIKFKNQISEVTKELEKLGLKPREVEAHTKPLKDLLDNGELWRHLSDALVVFKTDDKFEHFTLPLDVEAFSVVSNSFYLLPLMPVFNQDDKFYILAISPNQNRLYEASQHEIAEIETGEDFPGNMLDTVGYDVEQKSLQFRTGQTGRGNALYNGQGEGVDDKEKEIRRYLEDVDKSLADIIGTNGAPLVLASVENIFGHFREYSSYKNIYPKFVSGNFDDGNVLVMHEKAVDILQPYFDGKKTEKENQFSGGDAKITSDIEEVVLAAHAGSIETLFVEKGKHVWGIYHPTEAKITVHETRQPLDNCLLDYAARTAFLKNAEVYVKGKDNMPNSKSAVNAVLRF